MDTRALKSRAEAASISSVTLAWCFGRMRPARAICWTYLAGRVRIHLRPGIGQHQERIFTPVAIVSAREPATIAVAIDEDDTVRIDVIEGEICRAAHSAPAK